MALIISIPALICPALFTSRKGVPFTVHTHVSFSPPFSCSFTKENDTYLNIPLMRFNSSASLSFWNWSAVNSHFSRSANFWLLAMRFSSKEAISFSALPICSRFAKRLYKPCTASFKVLFSDCSSDTSTIFASTLSWFSSSTISFLMSMQVRSDAIIASTFCASGIEAFACWISALIRSIFCSSSSISALVRSLSPCISSSRCFLAMPASLFAFRRAALLALKLACISRCLASISSISKGRLQVGQINSPSL